MKLLAFWREIDAETGHLKRSFQVEERRHPLPRRPVPGPSEQAQKKYALLQTPVFVEEFILDRTLDAGPRRVRPRKGAADRPDLRLGPLPARRVRPAVRPVDASRRTTTIVAAQKALDGVWGVDINPFAVAIARFRLIVAAVQPAGSSGSRRPPAGTIHLATRRQPAVRQQARLRRRASPLIAQGRSMYSRFRQSTPSRTRKRCSEILGQGYHAVVGNPPYITVEDRARTPPTENSIRTCHQKYSLGVPFTQRFWDLAIQHR